MHSSAVIISHDKRRTVRGVPIPVEYKPDYDDSMLRSSTEEEEHSRLALKQKMMKSLERGKDFPPWSPAISQPRRIPHGQFSIDACNFGFNRHSKYRRNDQTVFNIFQAGGVAPGQLLNEAKAPRSLGLEELFEDAHQSKSFYLFNKPSFVRISNPIDFFMPQFKPYPDHQILITNAPKHGMENSPILHLDTSSTWKGLSTDNAEELSLWESSFQKCIEQSIQPFLQYLGSRWEMQNRDFVPFTIHIPSLVKDMVAEFSTNASTLNWFASAENVYEQVALFVKMHDCFIVPAGSFANHQKDPEIAAVHVRIRSEDLLPAENLLKSAELKWHPGRIIFEDFSPRSTRGQNFYLRPRYIHALTDGLLEQGSRQVKFSTTCDWLYYDPAARYFKGTIPSVRQNEKEESIPIIIKATIRQYFHGKVVYLEQQIRVRVTLTVEQEEANATPTDANSRRVETVHGTSPSSSKYNRNRISKTVRFALPDQSKDKETTLTRSLPIRLRKETVDTSPPAGKIAGLDAVEELALQRISGAWRLSEGVAQRLPMIKLEQYLKSSHITDDIFGNLSLGDTSSTAEWLPLELSNKFDLLSGRNYMNRPTKEVRTGSSFDMEASCSNSNPDADAGCVRTFVKTGNEMNPTLFESVRTAFRAEWDERQRGSPRRSKSSTCTSDTIHNRRSDTKSDTAMAQSQAPNFKSPISVFNLESKRTSPSVKTFREKLSALEAQPQNEDGETVLGLPKKAFKAALEIEFKCEEDPRDVRETKKHMLRSELRKMEQRMIGGAVIGKWKIAKEGECEDSGDGFLSSIEESKELLWLNKEAWEMCPE